MAARPESSSRWAAGLRWRDKVAAEGRARPLGKWAPESTGAAAPEHPAACPFVRFPRLPSHPRVLSPAALPSLPGGRWVHTGCPRASREAREARLGPLPLLPFVCEGLSELSPRCRPQGKEGFRGWDSPVDKQASHTPPWGPGGVKPGPLRTGPGQRQQPDQEVGVGVGPTAPGTGWACPRAGEALGPAREDPRHHRGALQGPGGQKVPASDPEVGSSGDQPPPWVLSKSPH